MPGMALQVLSIPSTEFILENCEAHKMILQSPSNPGSAEFGTLMVFSLSLLEALELMLLLIRTLFIG